MHKENASKLWNNTVGCRLFGAVDNNENYSESGILIRKWGKLIQEISKK